MTACLRRIFMVTDAASETAVAELMERELGQAPSVHHDLRTGILTVNAYLQFDDGEIPMIKRQLMEALVELREDSGQPIPVFVRIRRVKPEDWSESWKRHFQPLRIGGTLLVQPTWSTRRPRAGQTLLVLDPGMSFGTGHHATTRFCLEQLVACRRPGTAQSLLDVGTGSGILALAGAKLGFGPVQAFDFDADCVRIATENAALNGVSAEVKPFAADIAQLPENAAERFDIICANLIYDLLIAERDRLLVRLAPGGDLIVAGILASQFPEVLVAFEAGGLQLVAAKTRNEWRSGRFRWRSAETR